MQDHELCVQNGRRHTHRHQSEGGEAVEEHDVGAPEQHVNGGREHVPEHAQIGLGNGKQQDTDEQGEAMGGGGVASHAGLEPSLQRRWAGPFSHGPGAAVVADEFEQDLDSADHREKCAVGGQQKASRAI